MHEIDALQQRAAERWRDKQLARQAEPAPELSAADEKRLKTDLSQEIQNRHDLEHPGPEDELEL